VSIVDDYREQLNLYGRAKHDPQTCPACKLKARIEEDAAKLLGEDTGQGDAWTCGK
jgi:hypothetical protein